MDTVCHKQFDFGSLFGKRVVACFDGGRMSSDCGGVLLGEIDKTYGLPQIASRSLGVVCRPSRPLPGMPNRIMGNIHC